MTASNQRNKPCPCGSGKKYKHCCINKKQKTTTITLDLGEPKSLSHAKMLPDNTVQLFGKDGQLLVPKVAYSDVYYERPNKPKVLNKTLCEPKHLYINPNSILTKYKHILSVDTNTITIDNEIISVSCIFLCGFNVDKINAIYFPLIAYEFRNIKDKSENIGWMKAIQFIMTNPTYKNSMSFGLVVDSDLANIPSYNSKTKPIYSNFYLPNNFELIYASSDSGKHDLANVLIATCDKEASNILKMIKDKSTTSMNLEKVNNEPYTHIRNWYFGPLKQNV